MKSVALFDISSSKEPSTEQDKRQLHSSPAGITTETMKKELNALPIIKTMLGYIWPRDQPELKVRVVAALSLLVGAKVSVAIFPSCCRMGWSLSSNHRNQKRESGGLHWSWAIGHKRRGTYIYDRAYQKRVAND